MKKSNIIAIGVLALAGLIGARNFYTTLYPQHVVNINGNTLNLGQVYSQNLLSTVTITADGATLLTVTSPLTTIVKQLTMELKHDVNKGNRKLDNGEKMQLSTAYFNTNITIQLSTFVVYKSQYYKAISMPLESVAVSYTAKDELQFNDIIELAQRYQNKIQQTFNNNYNFID
ncbi:hypothetical protein [Photobacterium andalusiense]|uniref:Uncharacterized protein n=1 Tax=Photobacterium andalusiense TaxID=2204296 RepID=A0A1Y6MEZ1_9GAMM|nr:hypothetical protein [Photobacterium andalusiense]SMY35042.1 hypothetical protein PAND9192_01710 [Photobacterium andalusiense]